ncbi:AAA family ATPase [Granulicella sp. L60]|uniref:AAA family ATPase n=1 Tax=Granulicella sp. L60 TaxID=1641866 RepID=UPI00131DF9B6|nr:AAA family ATPase [Granulicella sp. L60]
MLEFPPFRLDLVNCCLLRREYNGRESRIPLAPKTFSVLKYLVENANRLVTHQELLDTLWPNTFVEQGVLSGYIRDLRAVLGDSPRNPRFIETVSRRGYRFIAQIQQQNMERENFVASASPRLVGREVVLSVVEGRFQSVLQGHRQMVFITGEPGIGKTSVCLQLLEQFAVASIPPYVAWGQCIEGYGGRDPYFPMFQAIGGLCREVGESVIQTMIEKAPTCIVQLPELLTPQEREAVQRDVMGATPGRMLREVVEALEAIAADRPLVLFLEDLQWVDNATVDVISTIARGRRSTQLFVMATYRPLDAFVTNSPIRRVKEDLVVRSLCIEVELTPLTHTDISKYLLFSGAEHGLNQALADVLYRLSEGNPLFVVAALEHALEQGVLAREGNHLMLKGSLSEMDLTIPKSLRPLAEAQISQLSSFDQQILEAASISGPAFSPFLIGPACGIDWREVDDVCHRLGDGKHIIRPIERLDSVGTAFPAYGFVHLLYWEVLYQRQAPGRRSERHRLIGEQLEQFHHNRLDTVASELAYHFEHAFDWSRTVNYLTLAAEGALQRYAPREALDLLEHALTCVTRLADQIRQTKEVAILARLASLYFALFDPRCIEAHEQLIQKTAAYGMIVPEIQAYQGLAACLAWVSSERCLKAIERALALSAEVDDPVIQTQIRFNSLSFRAWAGDWTNSTLVHLRESFEAINRQDDRRLATPHLVEYGRIQWACSEYRDARHYLTLGMKQLEERSGEQNPFLSSAYQQAQFFLPSSLLFLGDPGEGLRQVHTFIEMADKNGDTFPAQVLRLNRAWIHLNLMDFSGVVKQCDLYADDKGNFGDSFKFLSRSRLILVGSAKVGLRLHEEALDLLLRARSEMENQTVMLDWYLRLPLQCALAEMWLEQKVLANAREEADMFLGTALSTAERTWQALAWDMDARISIAENDRKRAERSISMGLDLVNGHQLPLAAWRVYATASVLHRSDHARMMRENILQIASSFPESHPLRAAFLSSRAVSAVLPENDIVRLL